MTGIVQRLFRNPVFIKEVRVHNRLHSIKGKSVPEFIGYGAIILLPFFLAKVLPILRVPLKPGDERYFFIGTIILQGIYFCYRAAANSWELITSEKEKRTYGNLIATTMDTGDIVLGKFWFAFYPLLSEMTILLPLFLIVGIISKISLPCLFASYIYTIALAAFFSMAGLFFSAKSGNSLQARTNTLRLMAFMFIGTYLLGLLLNLSLQPVQVYNPDRFNDSMAHYALRTGNRHTMFLYFIIPSSPLTAFNPVANLLAISIMEVSEDPRSLYPPYAPLEYQVLGGLFLYLVVGLIFFHKTRKILDEVPE